MEEIKTLEYDWEFGHEEIALEIGCYQYGKRLYIGMYSKEDGEWESFADLTVNLPNYNVALNEAYIDSFASESKLEFVRKHKLGEVLPDRGYSGFETYAKVAFDMDRLAEFDKEEMEKYLQSHGSLLPEKKVKKQKNRGMER